MTRKFQRLGCDAPGVHKIIKRCLKVDSDQLTLRIEPFGVDQKIFHFLSRPWSAPGVARACPFTNFHGAV